MRIIAVAQNTLRETLRDKVLYVLLFFAFVTVIGSKALGWISVGQDIKIIKDISLASISVFGTLIAIFVGASLVYKEVDKRTIYTIISRPMYRFEFILGKYLGLITLIALVLVCMGALAIVYIMLLGGKLDLVFCQALVLIYGELMLVTALAVLFSTLTSPILGAIIVFCLYVGGHATEILIDLPPHFEGTWAKTFLQILYFIMPNLEHFNIRVEAANGVPISMLYVGWAMVYGLLYTAMLILLASLAFEGKDV